MRKYIIVCGVVILLIIGSLSVILVRNLPQWSNSCNSAPDVDLGPDRTIYSNTWINFRFSVKDADGGIKDIRQIRWDFGDGNWSNEKKDPSYAEQNGHWMNYDHSRNYTIRIQVRDSAGHFGDDELVLKVLPINQIEFHLEMKNKIFLRNESIPIILTIINNGPIPIFISKYNIQIQNKTLIQINVTDSNNISYKYPHRVNSTFLSRTEQESILLESNNTYSDNIDLKTLNFENESITNYYIGKLGNYTITAMYWQMWVLGQNIRPEYGLLWGEYTTIPLVFSII